MRRAWISLLVACAIAVPAAGCGGPGGEEPQADEGEEGLSEEQREEAEREAAAEQIPEADRIAYYQVATSSGLLRGWAQAVKHGAEPPPRAGDAELRAAKQRLVDVQYAEDPDLDRLVGRLLRALRRATGRDPAVAEQLIAESDAINAGLQRYVRQTPVISVLLPD